MLAIGAAVVFAIALILDLVGVSTDALSSTTLLTLGLLLLALHLAGWGTLSGLGKASWRRRRK